MTDSHIPHFVSDTNIPRLLLSVNDTLLATGWNRNRFYSELAKGLPSIKNGKRRYVRTQALAEYLERLEGES